MGDINDLIDQKLGPKRNIAAPPSEGASPAIGPAAGSNATPGAVGGPPLNPDLTKPAAPYSWSDLAQDMARGGGDTLTFGGYDIARGAYGDIAGGTDIASERAKTAAARERMGWGWSTAADALGMMANPLTWYAAPEAMIARAATPAARAAARYVPYLGEKYAPQMGRAAAAMLGGGATNAGYAGLGDIGHQIGSPEGVDWSKVGSDMETAGAFGSLISGFTGAKPWAAKGPKLDPAGMDAAVNAARNAAVNTHVAAAPLPNIMDAVTVATPQKFTTDITPNMTGKIDAIRSELAQSGATTGTVSADTMNEWKRQISRMASAEPSSANKDLAGRMNNAIDSYLTRMPDQTGQVGGAAAASDAIDRAWGRREASNTAANILNILNYQGPGAAKSAIVKEMDQPWYADKFTPGMQQAWKNAANEATGSPSHWALNRIAETIGELGAGGAALAGGGSVGEGVAPLVLERGGGLAGLLASGILQRGQRLGVEAGLKAAQATAQTGRLVRPEDYMSSDLVSKGLRSWMYGSSAADQPGLPPGVTSR